MGQNISTTSLSCVDCGTSLITVEDNESRVRVQESAVNDLSDEVIVFETPVKGKKQRLYQLPNRITTYETFTKGFTATSPNSLSTETKQIWHKKCYDEAFHSELSSPSMAINPTGSSTRIKSYSSNFSSGSINLVDSIRRYGSVSPWE